jgi:hypothetical protein
LVAWDCWFLRITGYIGNTERKPLLLKDLAQGGRAKFDVSAYATTTYDKLLIDLLYLNKSKYRANQEKVFLA